MIRRDRGGDARRVTPAADAQPPAHGHGQPPLAQPGFGRAASAVSVSSSTPLVPLEGPPAVGRGASGEAAREEVGRATGHAARDAQQRTLFNRLYRKVWPLHGCGMFKRGRRMCPQHAARAPVLSEQV